MRPENEQFERYSIIIIRRQQVHTTEYLLSNTLSEDDFDLLLKHSFFLQSVKIY